MTTIDEMKRLVGNIPWKSVDKDNMEFEARASCYQVEAIRTLLAHTADYDELKERLEEAKGLMGPVAGWLAEDRNAGRSDDDPFTVKTRWFRALAAFLDREKEAGRG